ncbi:MAG: MOFRL family protein [Caldilineaceae bacterium]
MSDGHFRWLHSLPDNTTYADATASLKKWNAWDYVSEGIRRELSRTDRKGATFPVADFESTNARTFFIMPEALGMVPTARNKARQMGLQAHILYNGYTMTAEANQVGRIVAGIALTCEQIGEPFAPPIALIAGGELIVTVGQEKGMGGRNQEYALAAALVLNNHERVVMGSVDSDGTDGPGHQFVEGYGDVPQLTGGIVDGSTVRRAAELGIDIYTAIKRHDTSPALYKLDDGIIATQSMSMGDLSVTLIL